MSTPARRLSEFEPAVAALVAVLVGVAPDCALGGGAVAVGELVAPGQQSTGLGVVVGVVAGCGGQVVCGALHCGAALLVGVDGAEVLGPGQVAGEDIGEGMARWGCAGVGDEQQFGVGGRGVGGDPVQLFGG